MQHPKKTKLTGFSQHLVSNGHLTDSLMDENSDQVSIVNLLNEIIAEAVEKKSSDIHFEPYENYIRIRFRQDGILYEISRQPIQLINNIILRLKVMANLDISERRIPQDGRFKVLFLQQRSVDFRLSTCPTLYGEKAVVRILERSNELLDIQLLGLNDQQANLFNEALTSSQGLVLVTGPTGSGKTVTLYSALKQLNTSKVNISSVEDPIEIRLAGINQVQVNLKMGLTFATTLRSFLRQDPDIIMVGEMRDLETAETAINAAQTGHLVLSTLHTNNATDAIQRLFNMGIATFNIASSILLIIAQRLVRLLCPYCKDLDDTPNEILLREGFKSFELHLLKIYKARGCIHCRDGYKGRTGIYEVLPISKDMAELINANASSLTLKKQASKEKILSLRDSGLEKIRQGMTSLSELSRVVRRSE
jgi:type IV pilus assembly protein PilB